MAELTLDEAREKYPKAFANWESSGELNSLNQGPLEMYRFFEHDEDEEDDFFTAELKDEHHEDESNDFVDSYRWWPEDEVWDLL